MNTQALKSAARCPHCTLHMIPRRNGEDRYSGHVNSCPKNLLHGFAHASKNVLSLLTRVRYRVLEREIQSCGKEFLHMMFICTECFRFRYSNLPPQDVLCSSCEIHMHHVFSAEEIILDKHSLPKNF